MHTYLCVCVCAHMEVREQLAGVGSVLPCGSQRLNSNSQASQQESFSTKPCRGPGAAPPQLSCLHLKSDLLLRSGCNSHCIRQWLSGWSLGGQGMHCTSSVEPHSELKCRSKITLHLAVHVAIPACPVPPMRHRLINSFLGVKMVPLYNLIKVNGTYQGKQARELIKHTRPKKSATPSSGTHKEKDTQPFQGKGPEGPAIGPARDQ